MTVKELIIDVCMFIVLCVLCFLCGVIGYVFGRKKESFERNCEECFLRSLKAERNLINVILELREVSQALNECADKLLMIEIKYSKEQEDGNDD